MLVEVNELMQYKKPKADSTLNNMKKEELIKYVRMCEYNHNVAISYNQQQYENYLKMAEDMEQKYQQKIDRIVEQLEEKTELAYNRYMDCPSYSPAFARYQTQYQERQMCLDIVKAGGKDD